MKLQFKEEILLPDEKSADQYEFKVRVTTPNAKGEWPDSDEGKGQTCLLLGQQTPHRPSFQFSAETTHLGCWVKSTFIQYSRNVDNFFKQSISEGHQIFYFRSTIFDLPFSFAKISIYVSKWSSYSKTFWLKWSQSTDILNSRKRLHKAKVIFRAEFF